MTIGSKSGPRAKCGRRQELSEFDQWEVHIRIQNTEHLLIYHFIPANSSNFDYHNMD